MSQAFLPTSWNLNCPWCEFYIVVGPRGAHGGDPGAGVEAADMMREHCQVRHEKSWEEFLEATR